MARLPSYVRMQRVLRDVRPGVTTQIATNPHGIFLVPLDAAWRPAVKAVLLGRVWEPRTLQLVGSVMPEADIVHAGAFFGDALPALSRSRVGDAKVWAFEPNFNSFQLARQTCRLNGLQNAVVTNAGLSDRAGVGRLATAIDGEPSGGHSRLVEYARGVVTAEAPVELVALDDVIPDDRKIAALYLDVEGHETHVLGGARKLLNRCRPLLVLERVPDACSEVQGELADLGYRVVGNLELNVVLVADAND
jgi:FkbM family methyltransferase